MPRKKKDPTEYQSSGTRIDDFIEFAVAHQLPFAIEVANAIKNRSLSLQFVADSIVINRDTLNRILRRDQRGLEELPKRIISIAEILHLDPMESLLLYYFDRAQYDLAMVFYLAFDEALLGSTQAERVQAFSAARKYLHLSVEDRPIFEAMLDAFEARQKATPVEECGLPDTPSEE